MISLLVGGIKQYLIIGVIIAGLAFAWHVMSLKSDLARAEADVRTYEQITEQQTIVIEKQIVDIGLVKEANSNLRQINEALKLDLANLNERFNVSANGLSRDFGKITRAKPGLVNKIINNATNKVNRCFEIATGAKIEDGETNSECQELINTLTD